MKGALTQIAIPMHSDHTLDYILTVGYVPYFVFIPDP